MFDVLFFQEIVFYLMFVLVSCCTVLERFSNEMVLGGGYQQPGYTPTTNIPKVSLESGE